MLKGTLKKGTFFRTYWVLAMLIFTGCSPMYRSITILHSGSSYPMADSLERENIFVGYRYGALEESGNRHLARLERKSGHQLLAMEIRNHSLDTLWIQQDIWFTSGPDTLRTLNMEEAMSLLCREDPEQWKESVEVDAPGAMFAMDLFSTLKQTRSKWNLLQDMMTMYMDPGELLPGDTIRGLLMLQVSPNKKLGFLLTKQL